LRRFLATAAVVAIAGFAVLALLRHGADLRYGARAWRSALTVEDEEQTEHNPHPLRGRNPFRALATEDDDAIEADDGLTTNNDPTEP
jgi:hypothetical protein